MNFSNIYKKYSLVNYFTYKQHAPPQVTDFTIADINFVTFDKVYMDTKHKIGFTLRKVVYIDSESLRYKIRFIHLSL